MKKQRIPYWILVTDLLWICTAMLAAYLLRYGASGFGVPDRSLVKAAPSLLFALGFWAVIFFWMKLDGFRSGWDPAAIFSQLFIGVFLLSAVHLATCYLARDVFSRLMLAYFYGLLFSGFLLIRYGVHGILGSSYLAKAVRRVLIVGNGPVGREIAAKIERHPEMLCQVVGFLCSPDTSFQNATSGQKSLTKIQTLRIIELVRKQDIDEIIIALSRPNAPEVINLVSQCRKEGVSVSLVPHPYELYLSKPQLLDVGGLPILQLKESSARSANTVWKRGLDVVLGASLSVVCLPIVLICAVGLLRKDGGPFRRDLRCAQFGEKFWMYRMNSSRELKTDSRYELFLQQLSITELPQLWNVLRGEMSLVGPRPESPERVKHYSDWQRQRLNVKPGMTGLAQVHGLRETHSSEEKARFDLQYILNYSFFLDASLLLQTVWTLLARLVHFYKLELPGPEESSYNEVLLERTLTGAHSSQSSAD